MGGSKFWGFSLEEFTWLELVVRWWDKGWDKQVLGQVSSAHYE